MAALCCAPCKPSNRSGGRTGSVRTASPARTPAAPNRFRQKNVALCSARTSLASSDSWFATTILEPAPRSPRALDGFEFGGLHADGRRRVLVPGPATLAWSRTTVARFVQRVSWPPSVPLPGSVQAGPRFAAAPGRRSHSGSQARNSANVCGYSTSDRSSPRPRHATCSRR